MPTDTGGKEVVDLTTPIDFTAPGFALTARMSNIHVGPSWFFYTTDKGHIVERARSRLPDFGQKGIAARTDYLVEGRNELTIFLTAAKSNGREGRVLCARTTDGGRTWNLVGMVGPEPEGNDFAIMPSSVRFSPTSILTLVRHRRWIESYRTDDNGVDLEARRPRSAGHRTRQSAEPCEAARRSLGGDVRLSRRAVRHPGADQQDQGKTWSDDIILRSDASDWDLGLHAKRPASGWQDS